LEAELPNHLPGTFRISGLGEEVKVPIYKLKHFRCKSLKRKGSRSGIRVIYAYENDVLYAFSVPAYYYNGMRGIVLLNFKLTKKINFWVRFAHTFIGNRSVIGTGLDEINDQNRSEIKIQLRVKI